MHVYFTYLLYSSKIKYYGILTKLTLVECACRHCRWVTRSVVTFCRCYVRTTTSQSSVELVCSSAAFSGSVPHILCVCFVRVCILLLFIVCFVFLLAALSERIKMFYIIYNRYRWRFCSLSVVQLSDRSCACRIQLNFICILSHFIRQVQIWTRRGKTSECNYGYYVQR